MILGRICVQKIIEFVSKIGIIGQESYNNTSAIGKVFNLIKKSYGHYVTIATGGSDIGAENIAKKWALELGMDYVEYNPSYTGKRIYSALPDLYYGKKYHISHLTDRYKQLVKDCDYIILFQNTKTELAFELNYALNFAKKLKKKLLIID